MRVFEISQVIKIALLLFLLGFFYVLVSFFTANSYSKAVISGVFKDDVELKLFYAKSTHGFNDVLFTSTTVVGASEEQEVEFNLRNIVAHNFKLNVSSEAANAESFRVSSISFYSFFHVKPVSIDLGGIDKGSPYSVEFTVRSEDIKLAFFIRYLLPFFLACLFYVLILSFNWRSFPAISDLYNNHDVRSKDNIVSLDGLRGIAALTVLIDHTVWQLHGIGRAGVWLFFVLSGFLLIKPFVLFPNRIFTFEGLKSYFLKRIKRVLPMFYFMVTVVFLLDGDIGYAARHYLLVQGEGHFWTILHEFYFYITLPFVVAFLYFLFKSKYVYIFSSLVVLSFIWYLYVPPSFISIYFLGVKQIPFFHIFFIGVAGGYFYYGLFQSSEKFKSLSLRYTRLLSVTALFLLASFFIFSARITPLDLNLMAVKYPLMSAFVATTLILLSVMSDKEGLYNRVLSLTIFRLIGIVGYSFYLIHPYMIGVFRSSFVYMFAVSPSAVLPGAVIFICSFALTLPVAMFTYSYIERPFLKNT